MKKHYSERTWRLEETKWSGEKFLESDPYTEAIDSITIVSNVSE